MSRNRYENYGRYDERASERMYVAVRNNDLVRVQELLYEGADPNYQSEGLGPLSVAVDLGYTEIVELLLKYGGRLNKYDRRIYEEQKKEEQVFNSSPLYMAVRDNDVERVRELLEGGADPSFNRKGLGPLVEAVERGVYRDC